MTISRRPTIGAAVVGGHEVFALPRACALSRVSVFNERCIIRHPERSSSSTAKTEIAPRPPLGKNAATSAIIDTCKYRACTKFKVPSLQVHRPAAALHTRKLSDRTSTPALATHPQQQQQQQQQLRPTARPCPPRSSPSSTQHTRRRQLAPRRRSQQRCQSRFCGGACLSCSPRVAAGSLPGR